MIEKWRKNMDKGQSCAALLTDLSKAFDCIVHDFLIAKLEAYGFSYEALSPRWNSPCRGEGAYSLSSSNQCINKWSSSERCGYVRQGQNRSA